MHKFLGRAKFINPLGQKPAFGWFLSCVGNSAKFVIVFGRSKVKHCNCDAFLTGKYSEKPPISFYIYSFFFLYQYKLKVLLVHTHFRSAGQKFKHWREKFLVKNEMFMFSKKATKIDEIFTIDLTLCSNVNYCGILTKHELYPRNSMIRILVGNAEHMGKSKSVC